MKKKPSVWEIHPELVEQMKIEWAAGKSSGQIARILGHGITRNAVIGKRSRLHLVPHTPLLGTAARKEARRKSDPGFLPYGTSPSRRKGELAEPSLPKPIEDAPDPAVDDAGAPITMENVTPMHCRFAHGDPCAKGFRYCGRPVVRGRFCGFHADRCYQEKQPMRRNVEVN